ncbi:DUF3530 family protein [Shewanella sp. A32]|uniref:DUF3530 family protein n=1 Tax=Shewanella sp. A32 TaxID=3031327 RepID=UPI0023B8FC07|nr:DUF3530 family protein [Shewanella sp. A32]MDF0533050.1 DUF3530 family protein [Shewanella sp. A32]
MLKHYALWSLLLTAIPALPLVAASAPATDADKAEVSQIQIDSKPVTVLTREWQYRIHRGSVIIIPPPGQQAMSPGLLNYLRQNLNLSGWTTFSLTPPAQPQEPNFTTAATEVSKAGDGKTPPPGNSTLSKRSDADWQQLQKSQEDYLRQGLTQLQSSAQAFAGKQLLIAEGASAALVLNLLTRKGIAKPDLLVLINPYSEPSAANAEIPAQLAKLPLTVLDLQSRDANSASLSTQPQRQQVFEAHPGYRSRQRLLALDLTQQTAYERCLQLINQMGSSITGSSGAQTAKVTSETSS